MKSDKTSFSKIRSIDNSTKWLPLATSLLFIVLIVILIWFFKGGSFRLYASALFGFYFITKQIWVSVILIGIVQNLVFLPLRFIGLALSQPLRAFEEALDKIKTEKDQYLLFNQNVRQGNPAVLFYILSFILHTIAFASAGRIFLIDFYTKNLDPKLLYSFIPYPDYPLKGTLFKFPYFTVADTTALPYKTIFIVWGILIGITILFRIIWRVLRLFLSKNQKVLKARINYNRLLLSFGGISGTLFIASILLLRHIPTRLAPALFVADLTRPCPTLNIITAIGTFITAFHAGYKRSLDARSKAERASIDPIVIGRVFRDQVQESLRNGIVLGIGAFLLTNQIPSAFELSVATFEVIYIISPYTFDRLLKKPTPAITAPDQPALDPK